MSGEYTGSRLNSERAVRAAVDGLQRDLGNARTEDIEIAYPQRLFIRRASDGARFRVDASVFNGPMLTLTDDDGVSYVVGGRYSRTVPSTDAPGGVHGAWRRVANPLGVPGYGYYSEYDVTGEISGQNDIGDATIMRHRSIVAGGSAWCDWRVSASPLNPTSGFATAPSNAQTFAMVMGEFNPISRHSDCGLAYDARHWVNWHGGFDMVPETFDPFAELGGQRRGYNIPFFYAISKSPRTNTDQSRHARGYFGFFGRPNAIAAGGAFMFATGYQAFLIGISVVAPGSGYAAGDILTVNSGLVASSNEDAKIEVVTVDGSGAITSARLYNSGYYLQSFAATVGVTGGHGSGATFTYTLSDKPTEQPRAWGLIAGGWAYGLDGVKANTAGSYTGEATFVGAMVRAPNNQNIIAARNAAGTADVVVSKVNADDEIEIGQAATPVKLMAPGLTVAEIAASSVATPAAGFQTIFLDSADHKLKRKDSSGTVTVLA